MEASRMRSSEVAPSRVTCGSMTTAGGLPLPLERTEVSAQVAGPLAEVEVKQVFVNRAPDGLEGGEAIEAIYLFPLPHTATVHRLRFRIGSRTVEGVVKEKEEARRDYQAARR